MIKQITPCLWVDNQAVEAANFYTSVFKNSKIETTSYYGKEGFDIHGQKEGTVLTVVFQLNGQQFTALNGGPVSQFNEAVSFQVFCDTQDEIDYYWQQLTEGGQGGQEGQCGWPTDRFGVSWQIIPSCLPVLLCDPNKAGQIMNAFMHMTKFDLETLKQA